MDRYPVWDCEIELRVLNQHGEVETRIRVFRATYPAAARALARIIRRNWATCLTALERKKEIEKRKVTEKYYVWEWM